MGIIESFEDLDVYQLALELQQEIFKLTRVFPKEETYSLTDQIQRSFRSICANLREAWAKRRYEAHYVFRLSDCARENSETDTWLDYARDCGYLTSEKHVELHGKATEVGRMLGSMLNNPAPFLLKNRS
jgi:four helix bundle protein